MNEIVNQILLAGVNRFLQGGDKWMPKMHLRQPGFEYSACGPFTKNKERTRNFKETGDSTYNYQNKLYKALFQHEIPYGVFMDSSRRKASDKLLRE